MDASAIFWKHPTSISINYTRLSKGDKSYPFAETALSKNSPAGI
jgi:hypothetical protein